LANITKNIPLPASGSRSIREIRLYALVIAAIGFLLYLNTIRNGYALDDFNAIPKNQFVMEGIPGIPKLMTIDFWYFENLNLGYYRPLSLITFAIEHAFFGDNPSINHFDNALLYGLSGFILFLFLMQMFPTRHPGFAFLICLIFMAHPVHTEVVANIKSRDEILSFLNTFITLLFAFKYSKTKNYKHLIWSLVFFYLALLSKETAVVGIALIPLFLFYSGLNILTVLKRILPYAAVAVLFFLQKRYFLGKYGGTIPNDIINYPYAEHAVKLPSTFHIFWICLQKLIYPLPLSYDYSYNQIPASHWTDLGALLGLVSLLALAFYAFKGLLNRSIWSLGLAVFFITIAPSMGFVYLRGGIFAERFLYASCLGYAIIIVYALSLIADQKKDAKLKLFEWAKKNLTAVLAVFAVFIFFSFVTITRNPEWKDNITLFGNDVNHSENSAQVHRHFGTALIDKAAIEKDTSKKKSYFVEGVAELRKAYEIDTNFGEAYCEIGYAYQGVYLNNDSAEKYFKKAIETAPALVTSYNNLGVLFQNQGNLKLASYYYNRAMEVNPQYPDAIKHAADLKKSSGFDVHVFPGEDKPASANIHPQTVVVKKIVVNNKQDPKEIEFANLFNSGNDLAMKNDYKSAISYFKKAMAIKPDNIQNMLELANCYGLTGKPNEAIVLFKKILKLTPNDAAVIGNLALTYDGIHDKAKADSVRALIKK